MANTQIEKVEDDSKLEAIAKVLEKRQSFSKLADAIEKANTAADATEQFYGVPFGIVGYDAVSGKVDESIYEGAEAILAQVSKRIDIKDGDGTKKKTVLMGVVIFPQPTIETFAASEAGAAMLAKILEKECAHDAFRNIRDTNTHEAFLAGVGKMPTSVDEYAISNRTSSIDTEAFDSLWKDMREHLKENKPDWYKFLPNKAEAQKCMRSAQYAMESDNGDRAVLEEKNFFVALLKNMINAGKAAGIDVSSLTDWLAGRDTLILPVKQDDANEDTLESIDSFLDDI